MNIILHVEPKTPPLTWEQFLEVAPVNSIALDGYVIGSTRFFLKLKGVWGNF